MKLITVSLLAIILAGCSSNASSATRTRPTSPTPVPPTSAALAVHRATSGAPLAVVTAETEHAVLEVSPTTGRVLRRVAVTGDPTTLAAGPTGPVVVCSPTAGTVTLLSWPGLHPTAVLHRFHTPEIAAVTPDGEWALVSDAAGTVSAIELATGRIADRVWVGRGAHHMGVSPDQRSAWVALGETADTIVRIDTTDPAHLRVAGYVHARVAAHDLAFAPDGKTVWASSASSPYVTVYDAANAHPIASVAAGAAPQHVTFSQSAPERAYISSGYGRSLELVDVDSHRILHRAALPYGSFNLSTLGSTVATTSLLDGKVSMFDAATLHPRLSATVAPAAREIVLIRAPVAARRPVPDYVGRYSTSGRLADGGRARLSSNGNVHIRHGSKAALLTLRPWGTVTVACTDPTTAATFVLSRYARGESAQVQTLRSRPPHPFALVPIAPLTSPVTLPRSGPPQQVTSMQLSVATEAFSAAGTILVSVQTTRTGCEASAVGTLLSHG